MFLIFDTETTDLFNKKLELDHPNQARIVQLAVLLLDESFNEIASFSTLIKPDGWTIKPGAQAAHNISQEKCQKYGIPIQLAIEMILQLDFRANYRVAHNIAFDSDMLSVEDSFGSGYMDWSTGHFCTMLLTTDICKLPTKYPGGKYKWPKLIEAYQHIFNNTFDNQHDALADVRACAAIFKWLVDTKKVVIPGATNVIEVKPLDKFGNAIS